MKKELFKLINSYSNSEKEMDIHFFEDFVNIAVHHKGIPHRIKNIYFSRELLSRDNNGYTLAKYDFYNQSLIYYIDGINNLIMDYGEDCGKYFNEKEQKLFGPLLLGQLTLHELEHAEQAEKYDNGNSFESDLIRVTLDDSNKLLLLRKYLYAGFSDAQLEKIVSEKMDLLHKNRIYNPLERIAEIRSNVDIHDMIMSTQDISNLRDFYYKRWINSLTSGYEEKNGVLISPTETYLTNLGHQAFYDEIRNHSQDQGLLENLTLGLSVNKEKYESIKKLIKTR